MKVDDLRQLLASVADGQVNVDQALAELRYLPFKDLGFAKVDHHRQLRCGFPEVVFCQGKQPAQVVEIIAAIREAGHAVLATRADPAVARAVQIRFPGARYHELARALTLGDESSRPARGGRIAVVTAGTSDLPVATEAQVTAEGMGCEVELISDVGVAGLHRLLGYHESLGQADAVVVVAGMEGALASVVGGLINRPVVAVPTSVGYGASFGGVAALLAMLNCCASNVAVVNIDNGFGGGYYAALIARLRAGGEVEGGA